MVIALDLEGTLISNAVSRIPRFGLAGFLEGCCELGRVVMYTSVPEHLFRLIAAELVDSGDAPPWFVTAKYIRWSGSYKRLRLIPAEDRELTFLVDDMPDVVHPDDLAAWIQCPPFEPPYAADGALGDVLVQLRARALS